jgi:hypothetical protein
LIVIPTTIARTADNIRRGDLRQQRERPHRFSPAPPPVAKDTGNRRAPPRPTNPEAEPACTLPCGRKRVWGRRRETAAGLANDGDARPEGPTNGDLIIARRSERLERSGAEWVGSGER